jgi:hypothetical protein
MYMPFTSDCSYQFHDGDHCRESAYDNSAHCIFHLKLPDKGDPDFDRIQREKKTKAREKIENGDFSFEGAQLVELPPFEAIELTDATFTDATFNVDASFAGATFNGNAWFAGATFNGNAWFGGATFDGNASFAGADFRKNAFFDEATFKKSASFDEATFDRDASFERITIRGNASFSGAHINDDIWFIDATVSGNASFENATIKGRSRFTGAAMHALFFPNTNFSSDKDREVAYRAARRNLDKSGKRSEADEYFYREMAAKRRQKPLYKRLVEWPLQYIFWYGVYPLRLIGIWLFFIFVFFPALFWISKGLTATDALNCVYFSIVTATTLGYGDYRPLPGAPQVLASAEALAGVIMWAAFITVFSRKYMRS